MLWMAFFYLLSWLYLTRMCVSGHGWLVGRYGGRNQQFFGGTPWGGNGPNPCGGGGGEWSQREDTADVDSPMKTPLHEFHPGQAVEFEVDVRVAHMGVFVFELCRPSRGQTHLTHDCFKTRLLRDPTDERFSPYLPNYPEYTFFQENRCAENQHVFVRYLIPQDAENCDHCVLRWYWQTSNSCTATDAYSDPKLRSWVSPDGSGCKVGIPTHGNALCGTRCPSPSCHNEKFTNCVDIRLSGGGAPPPSEGAETHSDDDGPNSATTTTDDDDTNTSTTTDDDDTDTSTTTDDDDDDDSTDSDSDSDTDDGSTSYVLRSDMTFLDWEEHNEVAAKISKKHSKKKKSAAGPSSYLSILIAGVALGIAGSMT